MHAVSSTHRRLGFVLALLAALIVVAVLASRAPAGNTIVSTINCPPGGSTQQDDFTLDVLEAAGAVRVQFFDPATLAILTPAEIAALCPGGVTVDPPVRVDGTKPGKDEINVTLHSTGEGSEVEKPVGIEALMVNDLSIRKLAVNKHHHLIHDVPTNEYFWWEIQVHNRGPLPAKEVRVRDRLPPGCVYDRGQDAIEVEGGLPFEASEPPDGSHGGLLEIKFKKPLPVGEFNHASAVIYVRCKARKLRRGVSADEITNEVEVMSDDPKTTEPKPDHYPNHDEADVTIVRH
jgi:hypothetical protein